MSEPSRRTELLLAVVVVAYSAVLGGAAGLVWTALAPHIALAAALNGSDSANKALLGDDVWLAAVGIVAGVLAALAVLGIGRWSGRGPGAALGLAVGGVLGSLVAARVGHLVRHDDIVRSLQALYPTASGGAVTSLLGYFDFRVGARAVLLAWPVAAVAVHALALLNRDGTGSR